MGKSKRARKRDPLQAKASRVEKNRSPQKTHFPAWYHRISVLPQTKPWGVEDSAFDEDLSSLCETDSETVAFENDDYEVGSPNTKAYFEMKWSREGRKRDLLAIAEKEEYVKFQEAEEVKVEAMYKKFKHVRRAIKKRGEILELASLIDESFDLFCSDLVKLEDPEKAYPERRVEFSCAGERKVNGHSRWCECSRCQDMEMVSGRLYIGSENGCTFGPFARPTRGRRKDMKVKSADGNHVLRFKFFSNGYLKLSVSRDLILQEGAAISSSTQQTFQFVGVCLSLERKVEDPAEVREEMARYRQQHRSPSPKDNWFNNHHLMGYWNW